MGKLTVTSDIPSKMKDAGFTHAVVLEGGFEIAEAEFEYIAGFTNRFDAEMFLHANRIKEDAWQPEPKGTSKALQRKETASSI